MARYLTDRLLRAVMNWSSACCRQVQVRLNTRRASRASPVHVLTAVQLSRYQFHAGLPRDGSERDRSIRVRHLRNPSESTRLEIWIKIRKMHAAVCDNVSGNDYNNYRNQKPLHNSHTGQPLSNGNVSRAERID
jgi:hypothetical protein